MTERPPIVPFSEDSLNRFRITHPDRDLRPLVRRLHRLPHLASASQSNDQDQNPDQDAHANGAFDVETEREMVRLELLKWRAGVERVMASVGNLQRQRETYFSRAQATVEKTAEMKITLEREKVLLAQKQEERDQMIKCDEVAKKIKARGHTRAELDEQIAELRQSLADHTASHAVYLQTAHTRIDTFAQIAKLVEEVRSTKLPIEPTATLPEPEEMVVEDDHTMDIDETNTQLAKDSKEFSSSSSHSRLNVTALPFQPASTSLPPSRATSPAPSPPPNRHALHVLPSRPSRPSATSKPPGPNPTARLPSRPSTLRSVTTPATTANLEEGELGGEEEGEVSEGGTVSASGTGTKRAAKDETAKTRSTRSRK